MATRGSARSILLIADASRRSSDCSTFAYRLPGDQSMSMFADRCAFTTVRWPVGSRTRVNRAPLPSSHSGRAGRASAKGWKCRRVIGWRERVTRPPRTSGSGTIGTWAACG